ncbi:MAG: carboxypeptidase-like regulatory domain-containing protein, partial [Pedobacter sp.]
MKQIYLALLLIVTTSLSLSAQQVKLSGTIKDTSGDPVSFATIYIKGTTTGTSANVDGAFTLKVNPGAVTLTFRAIGYKPTEKTVDLAGAEVLNVVMTPEAYTLTGVTIRPNAEDPAFEIIRNAIKNRKN